MSAEAVNSSLPLGLQVMSKAADLNIPFQVMLELTYRCNLRCAHCYVDMDEPDELSLEEWKGVLDQLEDAGAVHLSFTGGEIMVRRDLFDILAYARQTGFIIHLLTNCTMVTPEVAQAFTELKVHEIQTSLYGATADTHESVTKIPGSFKKTLEGIEALVAVGFVPRVQTTVMEVNAAEVPQIKSLVEELGGLPRISVGLIGPSKTGADFPFQTEPKIEHLLDRDVLPCIAREITIQKGLLHLTCKVGRGNCAISPHGDVTPCVTFPLKLGNLRESSFNTIWRLEPCAELRYLRSMGRADLYACNSCELAEYCVRCTGFIYSETGQMNGPSPAICRQAQLRWRLTQAAEVIE